MSRSYSEPLRELAAMGTRGLLASRVIDIAASSDDSHPLHAESREKRAEQREHPKAKRADTRPKTMLASYLDLAVAKESDRRVFALVVDLDSRKAQRIKKLDG
jgi:hypothetical protein